MYQDEIDATEDDEGLGIALARTGYRRGAYYGRWDSEKNAPEIIEHFAPLNYTLHQDPEDMAFLSRSLARITVSKSDSFKLPVINNMRRSVSQKIADCLFFWRLGTIDRAIHEGFSLRHQDVSLADFMKKDFSTEKKRAELYEIATKALTDKEKRLLQLTRGRENELAYVALLIERLLGVNVVEQVVDAVNTKLIGDRLPVDEVQVRFLELLRAKPASQEFRQREITEQLEGWCKRLTGRTSADPVRCCVGAGCRVPGVKEDQEEAGRADFILY